MKIKSYIYIGIGGQFDNEIFEVYSGPTFRLVFHPDIGINSFSSINTIYQTIILKVGEI